MMQANYGILAQGISFSRSASTLRCMRLKELVAAPAPVARAEIISEFERMDSRPDHLHQTLGDNTSAASPRVVRSFNLPRPYPHFTGRKKHLHKLHDLMVRDATVELSHAVAIG